MSFLKEVISSRNKFPPFWKVTGWPLRVYRAGFFVLGVLSFQSVIPINWIAPLLILYAFFGLLFKTGKKTWLDILARGEETWADASYYFLGGGLIVGWLISLAK